MMIYLNDDASSVSSISFSVTSECSVVRKLFLILAELAYQVNRFRPGSKQLLPFLGALCYKKFIGEDEYGAFY